MLDFVKKYGRNVYSQNGEDGILEHIIPEIFGLPLDEAYGRAIEFGAPTKSYCSNIFNLNPKWSKYYWDINPQEPGITKAEITPENVNELIGCHACEILSIDIDGNDYGVWKAHGTPKTKKPDIVIIEINSSLDPREDHFSPDKGCNFSKMVKLGWTKGYTLLCHTGNLIFIHRAHVLYFPWLPLNTLENVELFFNKSWLI